MGNHAYHLVKGLERHGLLRRAHIMRRMAADLDPAQVRDWYAVERVAYRLARLLRHDQYVLRDNLFDLWVSRQLHKADIFYGWTHHALWSLKRAKRLGLTTVLERANSHPLTYHRLLEAEYARLRLPYQPYHPAILKKHLRELETTDYVAVTSQFTKASLVEHGFPEERILVTPLGVDAQRFVPAESPPGDDTFRVLYVGQLSVRKGIHYLLDAWERLAFTHAELVLVGDVRDELRDRLQHARNRCSNIRHISQTADPVKWYQQASVCILPTLEDGFGLVVLEAMACGVPVILTDHAGAKDCVRSGVDGFLIPPYSAEAIADALLDCSRQRNTLFDMGNSARQQAEDFSWERYQDGVAAHLRRIAAA